MIERKKKYIRIRVIGGAGIFDNIFNILKKPIVSKLLASAGKSVASALGERLVNRMIAPAAAVAPSPALNNALAVTQPVVHSTPEAVQPPSRRAQELISRYSTGQHDSSGTGQAGSSGIKQAGTGVSMRRQAGGATRSGYVGRTGEAANGVRGGAITIQEYIKSYKGAGIKLI